MTHGKARPRQNAAVCVTKTCINRCDAALRQDKLRRQVSLARQESLSYHPQAIIDEDQQGQSERQETDGWST
jgi:hypothetical protein